MLELQELPCSDNTEEPLTALSEITNTSTPIRPRAKQLHSDKDSSQLAAIVSTLGETNKLLARVVERLDKQEQKMEQMESKLDTSISSNSSTTPMRNRNKEVPLQVRVSSTVKLLPYMS